ncbi:MAG: transposase [Actinomycetota bacterium]|nr:transposase [Actinomycetota bacterium]
MSTVSGRRTWRHRAADQSGQVIDISIQVLPTDKRGPRRCCEQACRPRRVPSRWTPTAPVCTRRTLDELLPDDCHVSDRYADNKADADRGRLKARLRPMRGLK